MKVLKNGYEKVFYHECLYCKSEFLYTLRDTYGWPGEAYISCPVCDREIRVYFTEASDETKQTTEKCEV